ncbi:MAG TPA: carbohydrate-binding protein, partial [bacterium]|nr:carbohydrate-binding protein [bacterium]
MKKPLILSALIVFGLACQVPAFFGWLDAPSRGNAHDPRSVYYHPTPGIKSGSRAAAAATPTVGPCAAPAWSPNAVAYAVGAEVSYQNGLYQCDIANTSEVGWDPISAPA